MVNSNKPFHKLTRAQKYRINNLAKGLCSKCPKPLSPDSESFCDKHIKPSTPTYEPTLEEIRKATAEIRKEWSEFTYSQRGKKPSIVEMREHSIRCEIE